MLLGAGLLVVLLGGGGWQWLRQPVPPPALVLPEPSPQTAALSIVPPAPAPAPAPAMAAPLAPPLATEDAILADAPDALRVTRFAPQPAILVLQYPSLGEQGRALNRVAALLEKNGFPRDRVLDDAELERRIRATGASPETFYYGHDYRAADLVRFFALADRAGTALTAEEGRLRTLLQDTGWHGTAGEGALISLVRHDPAAGLDRSARATILRHELSHGLYFTSPAYAAYALRFWNETLSAKDRALFTTFLANDGYDPGNADLMVNETQAYLMHTPDPRFFNAEALGMSEARLASLRVAFLAGMPPGWLRDCTVPPATVPSAAVLPARAPRRRQRLAAVRTTSRLAARCAPPRRAESSAARRSRT